MRDCRFIKEWDFLGYSLHFKINKKGCHQTYYGGFLSICYYLALIGITIYLGIDMFLVRNPSGYREIKPNLTNKSSEYFNFTDNTFIIGYSIENTDNSLINTEDYLFTNFIYQYYNKAKNISETIRLKSRPCGEILSEKLVENPEHFKNYKNFLCPDTSPIKRKYLKGNFVADEYSIIEVYYSLCNHDKKNPTCKDTDLVKKKFEEKTHWINSIVPKVDYYIKNPQEPLKVKIIKKYNIISPYSLIYSDLTLNEYHAQSDDGLFDGDKKNYYEYGFHQANYYLKNLLGMPDTKRFINDEKFEKTALFVGSIVHENNVHFFSRSYKTLPDFIASIVGLMKIVLITVTYLSKDFSNYKFLEFLARYFLVIDNYEEYKDYDNNGKHEKTGKEIDKEKELENIKINKFEFKEKLQKYFMQNPNEKHDNDYFYERNKQSNNNILYTRVNNYISDNNNNNIRNINNINNNINCSNNLNTINNINEEEKENSNSTQKNTTFINNNNSNKNLNLNNLNEKENITNTITNTIYPISLTEDNPIINSKSDLNSKREENENNNKNEIKREEITPYLGETFAKYLKIKNNFSYKLFLLIKDKICKREKDSKRNKIIDIFSKKIIKKFDMFYYLRYLRMQKVINRTVLNTDQIKFLKIISNKEYVIDMKDKILERKGISDEEKCNRGINYFMDSYNPKRDDREQNILNYFMEKN